MLVVAHEDADQLNALVAHLALDFEVYVHVDRRGSMRPRDVLAGDRVHVISTRRVPWGSSGMVRATLDLMALAASSAFDRYVLVSGRDVPIVSNAAISQFFDEHRGQEFIECEALPRPARAESGWIDRVRYFYIPSARGVGGFRGRLQEQARYWFLRANALLGVSRPDAGIAFYGGSAWWNLTHDAVRGILDLVDRRPALLRRFRMTSCADELFFQTALVAVGRGDHVVSTPLRYVDWETGPERPRTLRADDYDRVRTSGMLFARKVDRSVDADLDRLLWRDVRHTVSG